MSVKFKSVEDLFPIWYSARQELIDFCNQIKGWLVHINETGKVTYGLNLPIKKMRLSQFPQLQKLHKESDDLFGPGEDPILPIPVLKTFPLDVQDEIDKIITNTCKEYIPDLSKFMGRSVDVEEITQAIKDYEHYLITKKDKRPIIEELKHRLGLLELIWH